MTIKTVICPVAFAIFIVVAPLLSVCAVAQCPAPLWVVGNRWKYESTCVQQYWGTTSYDYYSNQTMWYNVTGTKTIVVDNTHYDVYVLSSQIEGSSQTYGSTYTSYCDYHYNYTYYHERTNYSIVQLISYSNSTTVTYYSSGTYTSNIWQYCVITYYPPFDSYQFPINVNERWNVSMTSHSVGYVKSQYDNQPVQTTPFDTWSSVDFAYVCESVVTVNVPAGSFSTYKINQTYSTANSIAYTYLYYSPVVGNLAKMTVDQFGSQSGDSWESHTVQKLVDYTYTVVPEFSTVAPLIITMTIMTVFLVSRKKAHAMFKKL